MKFSISSRRILPGDGRDGMVRNPKNPRLGKKLGFRGCDVVWGFQVGESGDLAGVWTRGNFTETRVSDM